MAKKRASKVSRPVLYEFTERSYSTLGGIGFYENYEEQMKDYATLMTKRQRRRLADQMKAKWEEFANSQQKK